MKRFFGGDFWVLKDLLVAMFRFSRILGCDSLVFIWF